MRPFFDRFKRSAATSDQSSPHTYKAFISYSHAADGKLAPALQAGLHGFAKPWYKLRAMRVFRDETGLPTSPELWASIESALSQSEYFLFLASPEAAASHWVRKEFQHWMQHRPNGRMLIVLTDGELVWDRDSGDFDWTRTKSIPQGIEHGFRDEPLYLDLRWARNQDHLSLRNLSFRSAIADLASTLLQRPKDELIGEDVRRHRQTRRIVRSAVAALLVLTASSVVAATLAIRNQRIAEDRLYVAQSRQLAAQARNEIQAGRLDLALLLGLESFHPLEAVRTKEPAQPFDARSTLLQALETQPQLKTYLFRTEGGSLGDATFSPDRTLIAVATSQSITFWNTATWQPAGDALEGPDDAVFKLAFSPDGGVLAVGSRGEKRLMLFDALHRKALYPPLTLQDGAISGLAFSRDGKTLASGAGDHTIVLWDVESGKPLGAALEGHSSNVEALAFSPDGRLLASGSWDTTAVIWDLGTRQPRLPPIEHDGQVEDLAFSPDGQFLATASGHSVFFWDPQTGAPRGSPIVHTGSVDALAFSPDGTMLAVGGSDSEAITLWKLPEREPMGPALRGHTSWIQSLSFSPDSQTLASGSADESIILWRPRESRRLTQRATASGNEARALALSADGRMLAVGYCGSAGGATCEEGDIRLWRVKNSDPLVPPSLEPLGVPLRIAAVQTLAFGPADGDLTSGSCASYDASSCVGAEIRRWNTSTGRAIQGPVALLNDVPIEAMQLGANGRMLASVVKPDGYKADGYEIWLSDTQTGMPIGGPLTGSQGLVLNIVFGSNGQRVTASNLDEKVFVWDTATGLQSFEPLAGSRVALSLDGGKVATLHREIAGTYDANRIMLWDGTSGEKIRETVTPTHEIARSLALAGQSRTLAFGGYDGSIFLYDVDAEQLLGFPLTGHSDPVDELTFILNDTALISADRGGAVMIWDLDERSWRHRACKIANRNLSYDEWVQYVGNSPYRLTCPELGVPPSLADAGRSLATNGDVEGAVALLARAAELGDSRVRNAADEAAELAAAGLIEKATRLASSGHVEAAEAALSRAVALKPGSSQDPAIEARALAAPYFVAKGERLARLSRVLEALEAYKLAEDYGGSDSIEASSWDRLCLSGTFNGRVPDVLFACTHAIERASESDNFYDRRGVARALIGDVKGAIQDFEMFMPRERGRYLGHPGSDQERERLDYISKVGGWIAVLQSGANPFTAEELKSLRATLLERN